MHPSTSELATALRNHITLQPGERLYAVVDAAQDEGKLAFEIRDKFSQSIRMLFQGEAAPYMGNVAPYFVAVDPESDFLELWADNWGTNAGILLASMADKLQVFRHLRHIFLVNDEAGQEFFFRFYDPRVLRSFLPTCTPDEGIHFFGPITVFYAQDANLNRCLHFRSSLNGVLTQRNRIVDDASG